MMSLATVRPLSYPEVMSALGVYIYIYGIINGLSFSFHFHFHFGINPRTIGRLKANTICE